MSRFAFSDLPHEFLDAEGTNLLALTSDYNMFLKEHVSNPVYSIMLNH